MPALFNTPKTPKVEDTPAIEPPELKAERAKIEADKEKEKRKAAVRVQTILTGPGGVESEVQKKLDGQSVLGSGKPLQRR